MEATKFSGSPLDSWAGDSLQVANEFQNGNSGDTPMVFSNPRASPGTRELKTKELQKYYFRCGS